MGAGAPIGNKNAETWTFEEAKALFDKALELSMDKTSDSNDFIGEIAQDCKTTLSNMDYLKTKFPELESVYKDIKSNCEANCFRNGKKSNIVPSLAIMNLKSNHGWTDRTQTDITSNGKDVGTGMMTFFKTDDDKDQ